MRSADLCYLAAVCSFLMCASASSHKCNIASIARLCRGGYSLCQPTDVVATKGSGHKRNLRLRGGSGNILSNLINSPFDLNHIHSQTESLALATREEGILQSELGGNDLCDRTKAELEQESAREVIVLLAKTSQLEQELQQAQVELARERIRSKQLAGKFFLTFDKSLTSCETEILRPSDPAQAEYFQSIRNSNTLLKMYMAPDQCGLEEGSHKNRISGLQGCKFDIINQPRRHEISCEGAHVTPFTKSCNLHWEKLNKFRLNMEYADTEANKTRYGMWLYGYTPAEPVVKTAQQSSNSRLKKVLSAVTAFPVGLQQQKARKRIVIHSGYLHSAANFIALRSQHQNFDKFPSIMWFPLHRTAMELWGFNSDDLEFVLICSDETCYREIGANVEFSETSWISCKHPDVKSAFQVFGEVMSVVIGVVCDDDHSNATKVDNIKKIREYFQNNSVTTFQAPMVKSDCEGYFLRVKLNRPRVCLPGTEAESWDRFDAHPSPDPINLMCRSFNAFLTYLLHKSALHGIEKSADKECCKLFPSCLDTKGAKECILCRANALIHNPSKVPFFSSEYHEKLLDIVNLRSSEL
jgi:hypothetical protein